MNARNIMFQGTASTVGKSIIATAFCRIFKQDGYRVAPFKSQNMALNSYITLEGGEMGRAQVVQAEAAGIEPTVAMNPILLKPTADSSAQVIVNGKVYRNLSAGAYDKDKLKFMEIVLEAYQELAANYEIIVIEGAGSPAEINLRARDLVNMGLARQVDAPVILIGDIDKGGVFAALYGTIMLLDEDERSRVKGFIINKFRGDYEILRPGLEMIEKLTNIPVLGVVPHFNLNIDDEDSVTERFAKYALPGAGQLNIGIINYPYMSNFTDFAPLENLNGVCLRYFNRYDSAYQPDLVILPGTKNTIADLCYLKERGLEQWLRRYHAAGGLIMGICGGFQMLGQKLFDPDGVESNRPTAEGLGLLNITTRFLKEKMTVRAEALVLDLAGTFLEGLSHLPLSGYEIHMGVSTPVGDCRPWTKIQARLGQVSAEPDGYLSPDGRAWGTYLHGIFENSEFVTRLIKALRLRKGWTTDSPLPEVVDYKVFKEQEYNQLADIVRRHVDMRKIYEILAKQDPASSPDNRS